MNVDHIFTQAVTTVSLSDEERRSPQTHKSDSWRAFTVDGLIAALVNFREEHGGEFPVYDGGGAGVSTVCLADPDEHVPLRALLC